MSMPRGSGAANGTDPSTGSASTPGVPTAPPERITDAFVALDTAGIAWALLRPTRSIRDPDGDIDILVEPADMARARSALQAIGFVAAPSGWPGDAVMVDLDTATGLFCWLHVQPTVRIGLDEIEASHFLRTTMSLDGVASVGQADLLGILVLHGLLDGGTIKPKYRDDVVALVESGAELPTWAVDLAAARGLDIDLLHRHLGEADWSGLDALAHGIATHGPTVRNRISGRIVRMVRTWRRRGMSVAIIGPDGAGKSSLVSALSTRLPAPTASIYMGLTGGRMPLADRLRIPGVMLLARVALIWVRRLAAWNHQLHRRIVLFDRFPIDGGVPPGYQPTLFGSWSRQVQRWSCPPPNLAILLDAPGELLHQRSGEYDEATLESWRAKYLELAENRTWVHVIDARRPAEEIVDEVAALVWDLYRTRWSPRS